MSTLSSPEEHELSRLSGGAAPTESEKRAALEAVLATAAFERAEQLRSFLRYICEMEIGGRGPELSEYLIGIEALGKPPGYSTGDDAGVRKRAHDLRQRLEEVYSGPLAGAAVRIELPKGRYAPRFLYSSARAALVTAAPSAVEPSVGHEDMGTLPIVSRRRVLAKVFWFGLAVGVLAVLAGQQIWSRLNPPREIAPEPGRIFEAEGRANVLAGDAVFASCPACSGRGRVKWIGRAGSLTIPVDVPSDGDYMLQVDYLLEGPRTLFISVNDAEGIEMPLRGNHWWIPASTGLMVRLRAGRNTVRFFNPKNYAPDLDRIVIR